MKKVKLIAVLVLGFGAVVIAAPTITTPNVRNNLLQPAIMAEASFPAATTNTIGGMLFGTTAGLPYWSPGDGGSWQTFGISASYSRTVPGITAVGPQQSEGQKFFFSDAGTDGINGASIFVRNVSSGSRQLSAVGFCDTVDTANTCVKMASIGYGSLNPMTGSSDHVEIQATAAASAFRVKLNNSYNLQCYAGRCGIGVNTQPLAGGTYTLTVDGSSLGGVATVGTTGYNSFASTVNGSRIDFGAGASDYASSDGTTVTYAGPVTTNGLTTAASTDITAGRNIIVNAGNIQFDNKLTFSDTAATVTSACTSPTVTHGVSTSFQVDVGTSCTGVTTIVLGLPTASNGWECHGYNKTTNTVVINQTADTTASATLINFTRITGVAADFVDGADLVITCTGR